MADLDLLIALAYATVIVAVLAERAWLAVTTGNARLPSLATAAAMGGGALVVGGLVTAVERVLWPLIGVHSPAPVQALVGVHPLVELVVVFVAWDAAGFAHHWLGHRTAIGWASHQVHHTGPDYDLSLAWRQSWLPVTAVVTFPLVALTGAGFTTALACAVVSNTWQALVHTTAPVRLPEWLERAAMTPRTHRAHHASVTPVNLGSVLTIWDRLAGTWEPAPTAAEADLHPFAALSVNPLVIEAAGWRSLLARVGGPDLRFGSRSDWTMWTPTAQPRGLKLGCRSRSRPRTARDCATSSWRRWPICRPNARSRRRSARSPRSRRRGSW
ncbi:MAG: sterol desaturase family protein [Acidimicrobiales bacterium]